VGRDRSEAGISGLGTMFGLAALLVVLLIVSIVVADTLPSPKTTTSTTTTTSATGRRPSTTSTTSTPAASTSGAGGLAVVAACRSDVSDVQAALAAYQASNGSFPTPPAGWSAASYPANFGPLTNAPPPGPFLKMPPGDNRYVIMWDSSGHIWVEAPGTFSPTYEAANDGTNPSTCTRVAR
jgi:hypothetical protein